MIREERPTKIVYDVEVFHMCANNPSGTCYTCVHYKKRCRPFSPKMGVRGCSLHWPPGEKNE